MSDPDFEEGVRLSALIKAVPKEIKKLVTFCHQQYAYAWVGHNTVIRTQMSGWSYEAYFRDREGKLHCLPLFQAALDRFDKSNKVLFAW